jgi:predicted AAA+ superfamily ATPase
LRQLFPFLKVGHRIFPVYHKDTFAYVMSKKTFFERNQYMQMLYDLKDQNIIKVITGVRRCGKSTLLRMFADRLIQDGVTSDVVLQF